MRRIFVGPKEKNISYTNFFDGSITLIGSNNHNNVSLSSEIPFEFWNDDYLHKEIEYYNRQLKKIYYNAEIMAHNPYVVSKCQLPSNCKLICINSDRLLELLNNKIKTREYFKDIVLILKYKFIKGRDFEYDKLNKEFGNEIVVQSAFGSGGSKTFFCNKDNYNFIKTKLLSNELYAVSKYESQSKSLTIYAIIGDNQIEFLPFSEQKFEIDNIIEWVDSDYGINVSPIIIDKFLENTKKICEKLKEENYRGIINIDFLAVEQEVYLMEINARFGGTSWYIDKLLRENNLPSIYEYNYLAFNHKKLPSVKKIMDKLYSNNRS